MPIVDVIEPNTKQEYSTNSNRACQDKKVISTFGTSMRGRTSVRNKQPIQLNGPPDREHSYRAILIYKFEGIIWQT